MASKRRQTIAIDIDDVLSLNAQEFADFSNERWRTQITADDYDEDWSVIWGFDKELEEHRLEMNVRAGEFFAHRIAGMGLVPGAREVTSWLKGRFDLVVVTSRRSQIKAETLAWVDENLPGIFEPNSIHFTGFYNEPDAGSVYRNKGDILHDLGVDYLIDDQVRHCNGAARHGIRAILFGGYAWHERSEVHAGVTPLTSWHEVGEYFRAELE